MAGRIVVMGAGPVGLATAMLLAADGYEVVAFEKDAEPTPATGLEAWASWRRPGVSQFRQAHAMLPRLRRILETELPAVRDRLLALGARRFNLVEVLPRSLTDRAPREGDERFEMLTGRRPVVESAFAQVADDSAGVKIVRGVHVEALVIGPSARPGIPHVRGVRTSDGVAMEADLVIDAMGRRSKLCEWVEAAGGRPPYEESSDAGFAYYTRHYRSNAGALPEVRGPLGADIGTIRILTLPADNDTWTIAIVAVAGDPPLKALRHNEVWERIARACPHAAHWLDAEALTDVIPMAGVLDRRRRIVVDGHPVITGLLPVGDAWASTNPTAGRGISLGVSQAVLLRDAVRTHANDPAELVEAFDDATEHTLTPWYRDQVDRDLRRAARMTAMLEGRPITQPDEDPVLRLTAAGRTDADAARGFLDVFSTLALPDEVLERPGLTASLERAASDGPPPPFPGPSREDLVALTQ